MIIVVLDGSGDYPFLQAAVDALPADPGGEDRHIFVRNGVYHERVILNKDRVLIQGEDPERTGETEYANSGDRDWIY